MVGSTISISNQNPVIQFLSAKVTVTSLVFVTLLDAADKVSGPSKASFHEGLLYAAPCTLSGFAAYPVAPPWLEATRLTYIFKFDATSAAPQFPDVPASPPKVSLKLAIPLLDDV